MFKSKKARKATSTSNRFDPKKLIHKTTANMNKIQSQKYGYPPKQIKENAIKSEKYRDIHNFYSISKMQKHTERYACANAEKDKLLCRRL